MFVKKDLSVPIDDLRPTETYLFVGHGITRKGRFISITKDQNGHYRLVIQTGASDYINLPTSRIDEIWKLKD